MNLFRPEVLDKRSHRLSGPVFISMPASWQVTGYLLFFFFITTFMFFFMATYSRIEIAAGIIEPRDGSIQIIPSRSGVISDLLVHDGEMVPAGAKLAVIRAEESGLGESSTAAQIEAGAVKQDQSLGERIGAVRVAALAQQQQISAQINGLNIEIGQIRGEEMVQKELIESAQTDLLRAQSVASRGFISGRDIQQRRELVLTRQQQLLQLEQNMMSRISEITQAKHNAAQLKAQADAQVAEVSASRAQIDQQTANVRGARAYSLRAPVTGTVTSVMFRPGQSVSPQALLMTVVPAASRLDAQLIIPETAIGFVKAGMKVNLAVDAFPYSRFGMVQGVIRNVSNSSIQKTGANNSTINVYPANATLNTQSLLIYGKPEKLIPGMTVTARIVTDRQSLLRWLFDPLFATAGR